MISIVIPLYNKEKQIANTLQSVFAQTFQEYEIVIVNDGSTDRGVEIVKQIKDSRIRLIEQKNQGVSVARNTGIQEANYEYIALLDADDEWKPTYLDTQVDLIRSFPECSVYACAYEFKYSNKTEPLILTKLPFSGEKGMLTNYFEVASCSHPPLWTSAIIVRKESIISVGGFPKGVTSGEDLLVWAKLATHYKIAYNKPSLVYFHHPESVYDRPPRIEMDGDFVHSQLLLLYNNAEKNIKYQLRKYIGRWNEMRTVIFIEAGFRGKAFFSLLKIIIYKGISNKVFFLGFMILSPSTIQKRITKHIRNAKKK